MSRVKSKPFRVVVVCFLIMVVFLGLIIVKVNAETIAVVWENAVESASYQNISVNHPSSTSSFSAISQSFVPSDDCFVKVVQLRVRGAGGDRYFRVNITSAISAEANVWYPNETDVYATSDLVTANDIPTVVSYFNFTFSGEQFLEAGVRYCAYVYAESGSSGNLLPYHSGSNVDAVESWRVYSSSSWHQLSSLTRYYDLTMTVFGDTDTVPPVDAYTVDYSNVAVNSTMLGTSATMSASWTSNGTLADSGFIFGWNFTESFVNETWLAFAGETSPQWSNQTESLGSNVSMAGFVIWWQVWANDTVGDWNTTGPQYFTLTLPSFTVSSVGQNSTMIGTDAKLRALWSTNGTLADSGFIFGWNFTESFVNETWTAFDSGTSPQWSNQTESLGSDLEMWGTVVSWQIWANNSVGLWETTGLQNFTLSAVTVAYTVYPTGTFTVNGSETGNITAPYLPNTDLSFFAVPAVNYTLSGYLWNDAPESGNPLDVTLTPTTYMADSENYLKVYFSQASTGDPAIGLAYAIIIGFFVAIIVGACALIMFSRRDG